MYKIRQVIFKSAKNHKYCHAKNVYVCIYQLSTMLLILLYKTMIFP